MYILFDGGDGVEAEESDLIDKGYNFSTFGTFT